MKKNKKQRRVLMLLIMLLAVTIGFALLSVTLKINGTAGIKGNTWSIHWDDTSVGVTSGSVEANDPVVSTTTSTKDTVSFNVELELPGDFYEFSIDAVNEGSIDGALNTLTTKIYDSNDQELTGEDIPDYLIYSVKYGDGTDPQDGDVLAHGQSQTYKIRVEFDGTLEELPEDLDEDEEYKIEVTIPYEQYNDIVPDPDSFEEDSWATIEKAAKNGTACDTYEVGDTKTITLSTYGERTLRIANCSKPAVCNNNDFSQTACGLVIEFSETITDYAMNTEENTTRGGWRDSSARAYVNSDIYNTLPEELKAVIKSTTVISGHSTLDSDDFTTSDKLFYLSYTEIFGSNDIDTAASSTRQLDYYSTQDPIRAKINKTTGEATDWWLRSMNSDNTSMFNMIDNGGNGNNASAIWNPGYMHVAPAFKVG